jgi:hypothetical protein
MTLDQLSRIEYWKSLAPNLHIDVDWHVYDSESLTPLQILDLVATLNEDGYCQGSLDWGLDLKLMSETIRRMSEVDLPPVFAFIYDEFWIPFFKLRNIYACILGDDYRMLPDFWIWNVDPKKGDSGWKPHRDKGRKALFEDGTAKSVTSWIPLTEATPLNSCIYIVPAMYDETYATAEEMTWKFEYRSVRALPAKPGDFFIWNQAVLHWGSRSSRRASESRISMAVEFQRADVAPFNEPLLDPHRPPAFKERLRLIAKQILQYQKMYSLDPNIASFATQILDAA